jgi:hypothetical protein
MEAEEEWTSLGKETEKIVNDNAQIAGFYASFQVAGIKCKNEMKLC